MDVDELFSDKTVYPYWEKVKLEARFLFNDDQVIAITMKGYLNEIFRISFPNLSSV